MTAIRVRKFGGEYPAISARSLPDDAAQRNIDLMNRSDEFRPLRDDTVVKEGMPLGTRSIYRYSRTANGDFSTDMTQGWISSEEVMSVAKGQVNDDKTDRTYVSRLDGSSPLIVVDVNGTNRFAGVPAPTLPPVPVLAISDETTYEERTAGYEAAREKAIAALTDNLIETYRGITSPGTGTPGIVDVVPAYGAGYNNKTGVARLYRLSGTGGAISDAYSTAPADTFSWVMDPALKGQEIPPLDSPPIWAIGAYHYYVFLNAYGLTYSINATAARTALAAITLTNGARLFTDSEITGLLESVADGLDHTKGLAAQKIQSLVSKYKEVITLFTGGARVSLKQAMDAFYAKADVADSINKAFDTFAIEVFMAAKNVALAAPPIVQEQQPT